MNIKIIDWNNCHTAEQLESIDCNNCKNNLHRGDGSTYVTLIRSKGHWIPVYQGDEIIDYRCSECEFGSTFGKSTIGMNFCSCCGADNREVEE